MTNAQAARLFVLTRPSWHAQLPPTRLDDLKQCNSSLEAQLASSNYVAGVKTQAGGFIVHGRLVYAQVGNG